jgi:hypothetical protein
MLSLPVGILAGCLTTLLSLSLGLVDLDVNGGTDHVMASCPLIIL